MAIDIKDCDLNSGYYHFTNADNIESIMNTGLQPSVGTASEMVGDKPNVSLSPGGKGIMGIINSFIYEFSNLKVSQIPDEFKKYFAEDIKDFTSNDPIDLDCCCRAITRKLKDEVYFKVNIDESRIANEAEIGGFTKYDITLPTAIDKSQLQLITDSGRTMSAYDVAKFIYEKAKDKEAFRYMHEDFFHMFEMKQPDLSFEEEQKEELLSMFEEEQPKSSLEENKMHI